MGLIAIVVKCVFLSFSGHYIAVVPGSGVFRNPAILISPVLPVTGPTCRMTFSYFMQGSGAGMLTLP